MNTRTKNSPKSRDFGEFLQLFSRLFFERFFFDPNLTQTGNFEETPLLFGVSPVVSVWFLYRLGDQTSYSLCRLLPHVSGHMGVGVQGETCAVLAQYGGDRFHGMLDEVVAQRLRVLSRRKR